MSGKQSIEQLQNIIEELREENRELKSRINSDAASNSHNTGFPAQGSLSGKLFDHFFHNAPIGLFRSTVNDGFISMNQKLADILGYDSPRQAIDSIKNISGDIYLDSSMRDRVIEQSRRTGEYVPFINLFRRRDGSIAHSKVYMKSILDESGDIVFLEGMVEDTTNQYKIQEELKRSFENQKLLTAVSYQFTSLENFEARIKKALELVGKHVGISRVYIFEDSEDGLTCSNTFEWVEEGIHSQQKELQNIPYSVIPSWKSLIGQSGIIRAGHTNQLPEDIRSILEPQNIRSLLVIPLEINGQYAGFLGFDECKKTRDWSDTDVHLLKTITNIISNYYEGKRAYRALRESEKQFRTFTQFAPIAIMIYTQNKWVYANKHAEEMTGYSSEELCKMNYWEIVHPDFVELIKQRGSARLEGKGDKVINHYEFKIVHKNGRELWIDFRAEPISYKGKIAVLVSAIDITHHREIEYDLTQAKEKAEESDRLKSAFLATMSHELRTPLNAIIGFSDLIREGVEKDDIQDFAETINTNGIHLLNIIQDIFDLSMIESGKLNLIRKKFSLNELINEVRNTIGAEQKSMKKEDIKIITSTPETDMEMISDPYRLKQIMVNLLKNALKFTHEGFVKYGYVLNDEHGLQFYVKDSGIGIPDDKRDVIFQRFRQLDDSHTRKYEGTGLGLSICKELAERMGGSIQVNSRVGKGSIFQVTFPSSKIIMKDSMNIGSSNMKKNNKYLEGKTILIVEDDLSSYALLKTILQVANAHALWASEGKKAIEMCFSNDKIDLVLMDIKLPDISGFEATKKIKEKCPSLPVIAQTAYAMSGDKEKALKEGCDDYISKPIKKDHLMMILQKHLDNN